MRNYLTYEKQYLTSPDAIITCTLQASLVRGLGWGRETTDISVFSISILTSNLCNLVSGLSLSSASRQREVEKREPGNGIVSLGNTWGLYFIALGKFFFHRFSTLVEFLRKPSKCSKQTSINQGNQEVDVEMQKWAKWGIMHEYITCSQNLVDAIFCSSLLFWKFVIFNLQVQSDRSLVVNLVNLMSTCSL